jgi:hypothetical protein
LIWRDNRRELAPSEDSVVHRRSLRAAIVRLAACIALLHCGWSQATVVVTITGNKAKADITLPAPSGSYTAEFELEFENPLNLTVACLGIDADVLDAGEIASIESRLPDPANQSIDPAFPVRVTVEPPSACGLQFYYDAKIDFDTPNLVYTPTSAYRLVKAPVGGTALFHDLTMSVTAGSVRVRGQAGGFSEFVVVRNGTQNYAVDANKTYDDLDGRLDDPVIGLTAQLTLRTDLGLSRAAFNAGNYTQADAFLDDLDLHCAQLGGPALPNIWRSMRDLVNAEGEVVGFTGNLHFLLGRLVGSP